MPFAKAKLVTSVLAVVYMGLRLYVAQSPKMDSHTELKVQLSRPRWWTAIEFTRTYGATKPP